jgi:hypothetical protein
LFADDLQDFRWRDGRQRGNDVADNVVGKITRKRDDEQQGGKERPRSS